MLNSKKMENIKSFALSLFRKLSHFSKRNKILSIIIAVLIIVLVYFGVSSVNKRKNDNLYTLFEVKRGDIAVSVSGSGQVSSSNQIDLKSKVSGDVVYIGVRNGESVKSGVLLVKIDDRDATSNLKDAELSLESAKLALDKLKSQQEQRLRGDVLNESYEDGIVILANLYGEFSGTLEDLKLILFGTELADSNLNNNIKYYASSLEFYDKKFSSVAVDSQELFLEIESLYNVGLSEYQKAQRGDNESREIAIRDSYDLLLKTSELVKSARDTVQFFKDSILKDNSTHSDQAVINNHLSDLNEFTDSIDDYLKDMIVVVNSINSEKDAIENYDFDIRSQELTILQKENDLLQTKKNLEDYYIRADFNGVVARLDLKIRDSVSINTNIITLITNQIIAEVSLNEIDVAEIKIGNKVSLEFDAISDLVISGKVAEIDPVGTIDQGVVSYNIKITFESSDSRIKPSMSVSADIVEEEKIGVLFIPQAAIKYQEGAPFVQLRIEKAGQSIQKEIVLGVSNDEFVEVVSGLSEGDVIIMNGSNKTITNIQPQSFPMRSPGIR